MARGIQCTHHISRAHLLLRMHLMLVHMLRRALVHALLMVVLVLLLGLVQCQHMLQFWSHQWPIAYPPIQGIPSTWVTHASPCNLCPAAVYAGHSSTDQGNHQGPILALQYRHAMGTLT